MPDKFDRYREALVVETKTIWSDDVDRPNPNQQREMERALHANPADCAQLSYIRVMTGFCRQITVTAEDLQRLAS